MLRDYFYIKNFVDIINKGENLRIRNGNLLIDENHKRLNLKYHYIKYNGIFYHKKHILPYLKKTYRKKFLQYQDELLNLEFKAPYKILYEYKFPKSKYERCKRYPAIAKIKCEKLNNFLKKFINTSSYLYFIHKKRLKNNSFLLEECDYYFNDEDGYYIFLIE